MAAELFEYKKTLAIAAERTEGFVLPNAATERFLGKFGTVSGILSRRGVETFIVGGSWLLPDEFATLQIGCDDLARRSHENKIANRERLQCRNCRNGVVCIQLVLLLNHLFALCRGCNPLSPSGSEHQWPAFAPCRRSSGVATKHRPVDRRQILRLRSPSGESGEPVERIFLLGSLRQEVASDFQLFTGMFFL